MTQAGLAGAIPYCQISASGWPHLQFHLPAVGRRIFRCTVPQRAQAANQPGASANVRGTYGLQAGSPLYSYAIGDFAGQAQR